MIDFPASPTDGQIFSATNGVVYKWSATYTAWLAQNAAPPLGGTGDFFANNIAVVAINGAGVDSVVIPSTVVTGNSGSWYSNSTGRYTPPAGRFSISAIMVAVGNSAAAYFTFRLRKNGIVVATSNENTSTATWAATCKVEGIFDCNGSDYFDLVASANVASNANYLYFMASPLTGMQGPTGAPGQIGWRTINDQTLVGAPVVDVISIPSDINHIQVFFDCAPSVNDVDFAVAFYNASGTLDNSAGNYLFGNYETNNTLAIGAVGGACSSTSTGNSSSILLDFAQTGNRVGSAAGNSIAGDFRIPNIRDTTKHKKINFQATYINGNSNIMLNMYGGGLRQVAGSMTGFRLWFGSGTVTGRVTTWGSP